MAPDGDIPAVARLPGAENGKAPDAAELVAALAAHFGCEPEDVSGWIVGCERKGEAGAGLTFSSAWGAPAEWRVFGFLDELKNHIARQRS